MPPILAAKTAGLPRWAWVAITVAAVGGALILRSRNKAKKAQATNQTNQGVPSKDSGDPCDPNSTSYNPNTCAGQAPYPAYDYYGAARSQDSGDPCDPTSVAYDAALCAAQSGAGSAAAAGGILSYPSINVNYGAQTVRRIGCQGPKPKHPSKAHHFECKNGKYVLVKNK